METKREDDVRLSLQSDAVRGNVIAMVIMPREHFSADVRVAIQNALAARLHGKLVYYHLAIGDGYSARLHFCFAAVPPGPAAMAAMESDTTPASPAPGKKCCASACLGASGPGRRPSAVRALARRLHSRL